MSRRRPPLGIQTFRTLREEDCYHVDKMAYVERLARNTSPWFLIACIGLAASAIASVTG